MVISPALLPLRRASSHPQHLMGCLSFCMCSTTHLVFECFLNVFTLFLPCFPSCLFLCFPALSLLLAFQQQKASCRPRPYDNPTVVVNPEMSLTLLQCYFESNKMIQSQTYLSFLQIFLKASRSDMCTFLNFCDLPLPNPPPTSLQLCYPLLLI